MTRRGDLNPVPVASRQERTVRAVRGAMSRNPFVTGWVLGNLVTALLAILLRMLG